MNEKNRIDALEAEVQRLSGQLTIYQQHLRQIERELLLLRRGEETASIPSTPPVPPVAIPPRPISVPPPPVAAPRPVTRSQTPTEEYIGGNLLSKIGIAALVIGMAIFVKYAFDNDLIGPWGRLLLGWGLGAGLTGLALWLKPKYLTYSAVLLSGGVATAYLTTYAAFYFYHFLPPPVAFGLMVAITLFTVWQATQYEVQWIGLFGLVGAYAVPFLVGGNGAAWGLFVYMTILNTGVLALAYQRNWLLMNTAAFSFTWLIFIAFIINGFDRPGYVWISLVFGAVFFLQLYANQLIYPLFQKEYVNNRTILLMILNSFFYFFPTYFILNEHHYPTLTITAFTLANSLVHGGIAWYMHQRNFAVLSRTSLALMLVFLIVAVPIQLEGDWITILWAAGAAALYYLGVNRSSRLLRVFGIALIYLAAGSVFVYWYDPVIQSPNYLPYFNRTFLTNFLYLAALVFMLFQSYRNDRTGLFPNSLLILLLGTAYFIGWVEWERYFNIQVNRYAPLIEKVVFMSYSALYLGLVHWGLSRRSLGIWKAFSLGLSGLLFLYIVAEHPILDLVNQYLKVPATPLFLRFLLYVSLAVWTWGLYRMIPEYTPGWKKIRNGFLYVIHVIPLWILSQELMTHLILLDPLHAEEQRLQATQAGFSVLWGVYSLVLIVLGFTQKVKRYRLSGIALFGIVLGKLLIFDLSRVPTGGKIIIFLSVGVLLLVTSFLYQKYKDKLLEDDQPVQ
ncbi:DUF2339 domain-containing protein [Siphonobacter curvatus]|uniref:DUF2339 domain-containing protein n=1 Tax=Siphonobacter curvatus TaxID=2094562 RepID=A0A2S7INI9_9BACT|nr:DUF2339 domain-containing protein [Siphonobacter curvatus]PQA59294.1 hypothetical protein C5O19_06475 [Siphonobacter curvatus]